MNPARLPIRFEAFIFIVGIFMLASAFAPWQVSQLASVDALKSWHGVSTFVGGLLAIVGSLISYDFFGVSILFKYRRWLNSGFAVIGGLMSISGALAYFGEIPAGYSPGCGVHLSIITGVTIVILSLLFFQSEKSAIPPGLSGTGFAPD